MNPQVSIQTVIVSSLALLITATPTPSPWSDWADGTSTYYPAPHRRGEFSYTPKDLNTLTCISRQRDPNHRLDPTVHNISFPLDGSAGAFGAISDHSPIWQTGSQCRENPGHNPSCFDQVTCGQCFEVKCDGYFAWNEADAPGHQNTCKPGNSVVVKILDACPGIHPINVEKREQNFCNKPELNHIDLYMPAFDHIAQRRDGQIRMKFKKLDNCQRVGYWTDNGATRANPPPSASEVVTSILIA
ncbi:hypothetical protein BKA69DRAFT_1105899 [Paraphysoderma sedebokerense]|nr:hypothetical protein BKA69DRAFT_1105899 [Paraphysoderma sedebokerense]